MKQNIQTAYMLIGIARELLLEVSGSKQGSMFHFREQEILLQTIEGLKSVSQRLFEHDDVGVNITENVAGYESLKATILQTYGQTAVASEKEAFATFFKAWPKDGNKRSKETEWNDFKRKHKDYLSVSFVLLPAIEKEKEWREHCRQNNLFLPTMKNMKTWLNQRCWEQTHPEIPTETKQEKLYTYEAFVNLVTQGKARFEDYETVIISGISYRRKKMQ
ncbi:MAG: hypothetical protein LUE98_11840 [Tannerellaceae bacterium]|nr:hypothetical protein [Tannerellaceae bacterium]